MLDNISVVLVETSHPGNIGASARAMKVMGLKNLVLVSPKVFPNPLATAMASGAGDVLDNARVCDSLSEAVGEAALVVGTSARLRDVAIDPIDPSQAAIKVAHAARLSKVALVFGSERTGLTNEELCLCNVLVTVPTSAEYSSLNLAQAVQLLSYECFKAMGNDSALSKESFAEKKASRREVEGLMDHLETVMKKVKFLNEHSPKRLMNRLWRLFNRSELEEKEVNILRGFLTQVEKQGDRNG